MAPRIGLAVRIPDENGALSRVKKGKKLPLHARPGKVPLDGATVALVQNHGRVVLTATVVRISRPQTVRLLTGKFHKGGCLLYLKSMRSPNPTAGLHIRWRAIGQFRYFDVRKWSALILGAPVDRPNGSYLDDAKVGSAEHWIPKRPFSAGIPGIPHDAPEAELVRQYVAWLRAESEFEHHYLYAERLFTDLFDHSRWRLLEAKVACDRDTVRTAIGQLFDYKRFYARTPSLGVLLGSKPSAGCLSLLSDCGVKAVWRTARGRFCDSTEDRAWTSRRRRPK